MQLLRFKKTAAAGTLLALAAVALAADDQAALSKSAEAPPEALSEAVRGVLAPAGYTIAINGSPTATLWFRAQLPQTNTAEPGLGVSFGGLDESIFVGVAQLVSPWNDYKGNSVAEGLYTMRYAIQPADGNHMGVSLYRDFLLLIPAEADPDPTAGFDHDTVVSLSMDTARLTHPSVLALFPVWEPVDSPTLRKNDMDQWMLATPFGELNLGLTVTGKGEH